MGHHTSNDGQSIVDPAAPRKVAPAGQGAPGAKLPTTAECQALLLRLCRHDVPRVHRGGKFNAARLDREAKAGAQLKLVLEYRVAAGQGVTLAKFVSHREETLGERIEPSTLWRLNQRCDGTAQSLLDGRLGHSGRPSRLSLQQQVEIIALHLAEPWKKFKKKHKEICHRWGEQRAPSYGAFCDLLHSLRDDVSSIAEGGMEAFNKNFRLRAQRFYPHAYHTWQTDEHVLKVLAYDPDTDQVISPHLIATIDCASRLVPAGEILARKATTADLVRLYVAAALPKADPADPIMGLPENNQSDNENLFKSLRRSLGHMGVESVLIPKRCPEANGRVEAFFKIVTADFSADFTAYVRRKVKRRELVREAVPLPRLRILFGEWLHRYNFEREHGSTDKTPVAAFLEDRDKIKRLNVDEAWLRRRACLIKDRVLQPYGIRAGRHRFYTSSQVADRVGQKVEVFFSVFAEHGGTVCVRFEEDGKEFEFRCDDGSDPAHNEELRAASSRHGATLLGDIKSAEAINARLQRVAKPPLAHPRKAPSGRRRKANAASPAAAAPGPGSPSPARPATGAAAKGAAPSTGRPGALAIGPIPKLATKQLELRSS